ncbi:50S ribosomal protein L5 [bacterium]|nr:50S ribosomal protein L5 [bacterium]
MIIHLKDKYKKEVIPKMKEKFGYKNDMAVPSIKKVVVNVGFGRYVTNKTPQERESFINFLLNDLALITGQKPVLKNAKKSISGFKLRKGMPVGAVCTLRGQRMYDFLERLIHIALPRSRDFKGIDQKSIDKNGNLTIGIKEHIVFPEVSPEKAKQIFGLEVSVVTNAKTREEGLELFKLLGFPIKNT